MSARAEFADVTEAARKYAAENMATARGGFIAIDGRVTNQLAAWLGMDFALAGHRWDQEAARGRFDGQVRRAFDKLADQGALRKAAAGKPGPDGRETYRRDVRYYTPETWDAAARQAEADRASADAERARWEAVHDWLEGLGLESIKPRGREARLALEDWEKLRERAVPDSAVLAEAERRVPRYLRAERGDGEPGPLAVTQYWLRCAADVAHREGS